MNQNRMATVKVGLLTTLSLAVLITTVIWLRGRTLGGGQPFEVDFKDVDGLREGAPVQFMGIRVGFVDEVTPIMTRDHKYRVKVRFTIIEKDIKVPRGTFISLEQSGIIGEKFMELTPPHAQSTELTYDNRAPEIKPELPIVVRFRDATLPVGVVEDVREIRQVKMFKPEPSWRYQIRYAIDHPGYFPPERIEFTRGRFGDKPCLMLEDKAAQWMLQPPKTAYFTLDEPLRLKRFLEQQLASAEALKMTNERINKLLSDEAIESVQNTLKNAEALTGEATEVLVEANKLFSSSSKDLKVLVNSAQKLTDSVVAVSTNVNDLIGDPELKTNVLKTVKSVEQSTEALSKLLNDPNLKLMLSDAKVTTENAAELAKYLKTTAVDNDLQGKLNESITLLNASLNRMSKILADVEEVSQDKATVKQIIQDTQETSKNLNKFSEKLNKRFLLFRLLF